MSRRDGVCMYKWCQQEFTKASLCKHMMAIYHNYYCHSLTTNVAWMAQSGAITHQARVRQNRLESEENHAEKALNRCGVAIPANQQQQPAPIVPRDVRAPVTPLRHPIVSGNVPHALPPRGLVVARDIRASPVTPERPPPFCLPEAEIPKTPPPTYDGAKK
ncbi:hypothetical protein FN846DRAFT_913642 [Sphaerosporella brunnea]|uniref:Uncharacterized protein n=1 Tax=Sphaerosporella brunnea TaxID=1250544 RepID=A0A5J5EDT0_9PEZI|nr:hypothetical protein FN846DRAFT_913642 [Sphaerosporella brunnea]